MKKPDIPDNESTRLQSLRSLDILDTAPEERFDRVTRLARKLFGVPIALVSLVDEHRQWFKSRQGLEATETPRDISFCGHTILSEETFIIEDTRQDKRFADNPLVAGDPNIRFYAGHPLSLDNGDRLGTLCLIDSNPRELDSEELVILEDLAAMVSAELAAFQLATLDELTQISNRRGFTKLAEHSLNLAARQGMPIELVYLDMDNFKDINDRFGHKEGDRALRAFADQMRSVFRDSDLFARLSGDEFVVLLTNSSGNLVLDIMERFQQKVWAWNRNNNTGYELGFSFGAAEFDPARHNNIEDLLHEADAAMYRCKQARKQSRIRKSARVVNQADEKTGSLAGNAGPA